jgi:NADP-dependent 3-hydroxy acid dehydrogenase YdfG
MKKAIIIGATSGIGREVAIRLIDEGWKVAISGRREERLQELQNKYGEDKVIYAVMDITREDSVAALDLLLEKMGPPDLFLHVSGVGKQNPQLKEDIEIWTMKTNCEGMVRMISHIMNYIKGCPVYNKKIKAHVAVITSLAGTAGLGSAAAYSASKKMQNTYISALSQLSRQVGIPVQFTDIRPGFVKTDILDLSHNYPFLISVETAADHIMYALRRKKRIYIFDWRFRIITALWRLIPIGIWERMSFIKTD